MNVSLHTRGAHSLTTLSPMVYCWAASYLITAVHHDENFQPSSIQVGDMVFYGSLDRYLYRISIVALDLSNLMFYKNRLLVYTLRASFRRAQVEFAEYEERAKKGMDNPYSSYHQLVKWYIPTAESSKAHSSSSISTYEDGITTSSPVSEVLHTWADRIAGQHEIEAAEPSVLFGTNDDGLEEGETPLRKAEEYRRGIVTALWEVKDLQPTGRSGRLLSKKRQKNSETESINEGDPTAGGPGKQNITQESESIPRIDSDFLEYSRDRRLNIKVVWMSEAQCRKVVFESPWVADMIRVAFKARRGESIASSGYCIGTMK